MIKILTITILSAALLANSMMARGVELGDCTELVPKGSDPSATCRKTEIYEVKKPTQEELNELDQIEWKTIKSESSDLDAAREYVKKHGKMNCIETVPEGSDQSEICKETDLYQPIPTIRKEVKTWEL